jgi:MFS family permease
MPDPMRDVSYAALLRLPHMPRILLGMSIGRIASGMAYIAVVLFTLDAYQSPALAGIVTLALVLPGVLLAPLAGALLDRHGRVRLVIVGALLNGLSFVALGGLALAGELPPWLLVVGVGISSITGPLANGLRSLFPVLVPPYLWERVNAVDSNGYVLATLVGPPVAGVLVQVIGGPATLIVIGVIAIVAGLVMVGMPDPATAPASSDGGLARDAWDGLVYVLRDPTMRGLAFSMTAVNLGGGMAAIMIPLLVQGRYGAGPVEVGLVWAVSGAAGGAAALFFGRRDTRGKERTMMAWAIFLSAFALLLLLPDSGLWLVFVALGAFGFLNGPLDIALFTIRQRRTDPAWLGRAIVVSGALNFVGFPIGSAITGWLVGFSVTVAVLFGVVACLAGGLIAWLLIPARVPERPEPTPPPAEPGQPAERVAPVTAP